MCPVHSQTGESGDFIFHHTKTTNIMSGHFGNISSINRKPPAQEWCGFLKLQIVVR